MENVTIQSLTPKKQGIGKTGKPWTITEFTLSDGRKVDSFDAFALGESADVEIVPNADARYNATMKRVNQKKNDFLNQKNAEIGQKILANTDTKDQRITMLSCISSACTFYQQREADEGTVHNFAKSLFALAMNHKQDQLPF